MQKITANLWFNNNAQEAVAFYMTVFKDGRILNTDYYTEVGEEITGHKKGDVVTIEFEIRKTRFIAINAGPQFPFTPAVSFMIECKDQREIDYYWNALSAVPQAEQCGWVQDKHGLSWQIVPENLSEILQSGSEAERKRVTETYFSMKKFDIKAIEEARHFSVKN